MKVISENIPDTKGIRNSLIKVDYSDTYATTNHIDDLETIINLVFSDLPNWASKLMKLRNRIVKIFGLKTEKPAGQSSDFKVGGYIGFFKIYDIINNEVIFGADDKHLNLRVSVFNSQKTNYNIKISTLVEYNNTLGRIYMTIVRPFHHLIVKQVVKKAYKGTMNIA